MPWNPHYFLTASLLLLMVQEMIGGSINRPPLCPNIKLKSNGSILEKVKLPLGSNISGFFIDQRNHIYITDFDRKQVKVWSENGDEIQRTVSSSKLMIGLFVEEYEGATHLYLSDAKHVHRMNPWTDDLAWENVLKNIDQYCWGIFIDHRRNLYCSSMHNHRVLFYPSDQNNPAPGIGTGECEPSPSSLCNPSGIYVDEQLNLYVADTGNRRIQLSKYRSSTAETFYHEMESSFTPRDIVMDSDDNLWVVDQGKHRILRCSRMSCQCMVGCEGQLQSPSHLAFDRYGNLFVVDAAIPNIVKFTLERNTCYFYPSPRLCRDAQWDPTAITLADKQITGLNPRTLFIDVSDLIYIINHANGNIQVLDTNEGSQKTLQVSLYEYSDIFVGMNGDIYFEDAKKTGHIKRWSVQLKAFVSVAQFDAHCRGLFIDNNNTLYCSAFDKHRVMSVSLDTDDMKPEVVVTGLGRPRCAPKDLKYPWNIFVDQNYTLYVTDANHNRILRFRRDNLDGDVIFRNRVPSGLQLKFPTDLLVYSNDYSIIADDHHHRILRSDGKEWWCIAACSGPQGSRADQLHHAIAVQLDSHGNLYVADEKNHRIQKFMLITDGCLEDDEDIDPSSGVCKSSVKQNDGGSLSSECKSIGPQACRQPHIDCNIFKNYCQIVNPCHNQGTCYDDNNDPMYYCCECIPGTNGTNCKNDYRICDPDPCLNGGTCTGTSKTDYKCACPQHWTGDHCEKQVNYCSNRTCLNKGVCRPIFGGSVCECLKGSYSGPSCEITETRVIILQIASKSLAFVAILAMVSVALFVIIMDILKYCFGIDPTAEDLEYIRKKKRAQKRKQIGVHFIYVNHPDEHLRSGHL